MSLEALGRSMAAAVLYSSSLLDVFPKSNPVVRINFPMNTSGNNARICMLVLLVVRVQTVGAETIGVREIELIGPTWPARRCRS